MHTTKTHIHTKIRSRVGLKPTGVGTMSCKDRSYVADAAKLAKPSATVPTDMDTVSPRMVECGQTFLYRRAVSAIKEHPEQPMLWQYCGDSTPMTCRKHWAVRYEKDAPMVRRSGGERLHLYMERGTLVLRSSQHESQALALFERPRHIEVENAEVCHTLCCEFLPLLHELGARGWKLSHYAFDRHFYKTLLKMQRQRRKDYYSKFDSPR